MQKIIAIVGNAGKKSIRGSYPKVAQKIQKSTLWDASCISAEVPQNVSEGDLAGFMILPDLQNHVFDDVSDLEHVARLPQSCRILS